MVHSLSTQSSFNGISHTSELLEFPDNKWEESIFTGSTYVQALSSRISGCALFILDVLVKKLERKVLSLSELFLSGRQPPMCMIFFYLMRVLHIYCLSLQSVQSAVKPRSLPSFNTVIIFTESLIKNSFLDQLLYARFIKI